MKMIWNYRFKSVKAFVDCFEETLGHEIEEIPLVWHTHLALDSANLPPLAPPGLKPIFNLNLNQKSWGNLNLIHPLMDDDQECHFRMLLGLCSKQMIPGQRAMLQSLVCVSGPSQARPPCWGGAHILVLVRWPRPHVNEHRLHGDHSSHTPCTAGTEKVSGLINIPSPCHYRTGQS